MGLTFQQKFYMIPEVFLVYNREDSGRLGTLKAIIPVPDEDWDEQSPEELEEYLLMDYYVERVWLDELASQGYKIMKGEII